METGVEQSIAIGKDSEVFLIKDPETGQKKVRKVYDNGKYPLQSEKIKTYVELMNRGHEEITKHPLSTTIFGKNMHIEILPASEVVWDLLKKAWTTVSPFIEGSNLVRLYEVGINEQNQPSWTKSTLSDLNVPNTLSNDEYFDILDKVEKIQREIAAQLGLNKIYIGMENMILTPDNRLIITDLGHNIEDLNLG